MRFRIALLALFCCVGTVTLHAQTIDISAFLKPSISLYDSAAVQASPLRLYAQADSATQDVYTRFLQQKNTGVYAVKPTPDCVLPDEAMIASIPSPMQDRMPVLQAPEHIDPKMVVHPCALQPSSPLPRR